MAVLCTRCRGLGVEVEDQPITCVVLGGPCSPCEERATIQHRIKQLEEEITKLKATQQTLGIAMNAIHDPFIHKFPPEISSRILHLSLSTLEYYSKATGYRFSPAVWAASLNLGSVCRKWRQLAQATPDLWTTLHIVINPSMTPSMAESLPGLLREWLGRSGMLPLTIYFFHDRLYRSGQKGLSIDSFDVATTLAIDILKLHSGRWRNLHLTATSADLLKCFPSSAEPKQLVGLSLELALPVSESELPTLEFMMESRLNLTHLKLTRFPLKSINVHWDNITHATFSMISIDEGLDFLRRAPSLEYYCTSMCEQRDTSYQDPLFHPRLRSLDLSTPPSKHRYVLDVVQLPSLEEWTHNLCCDRLPVAAMLSFLKRSGCRIKALKLENIRLPSEDLNTLLQEIPSLERVQVSYRLSSNKGIMDDILTRIFYSVPEDHSPGGSFLPHLQFIECKTDTFAAPFSWGSIPKFYRHGHRRSLKLKAFARTSDIPDETALQLLQLADEGVDLQIVDLTMVGDFLENFRKRISAQGD
jgi:hypothetical protein